MFLGTYENRIDDKGRVSVPARFRLLLSSAGSSKGLVVFPSYRSRAIECCSYEFMDNLRRRTEHIDFFSEQQDDWSLALFSAASEAAIDGQGRIVLSPALCAHANLENTAVFVGRGSLFQIWAVGRIEALRNQARERLRSNGATLPSSSDATLRSSSGPHGSESRRRQTTQGTSPPASSSEPR